MKINKQSIKQFMKGFTIIELMVATAVFTLILIIVTYGIINISRAYYRGVTVNQTQNAARNIANTLTQGIEFDGSYTQLPANGVTQGFCIGNQLFSYILGYRLQVNGTYDSAHNMTAHSFVEDVGGCSLGMPQDLTTNAKLPGTTELMGNNMRLAYLNVSEVGSTGLYTIDVRVVYGSDNLLCNQAADPGSCSTNTTVPSADFIGNVQCKTQIGDQFCDASELSTTVAQRIN